MSSFVVAAVQLTSTADKDSNFERASVHIAQAAERGAWLVCLPECFMFIGTNSAESLAAAETLEGQTISRYRDLARSLNVWLSLGGFQECNEEDHSKISNTHVIISSAGEIVSTYRKIHLFDAPVVSLMESMTTAPGDEIITLTTDKCCIGLSICYDLRFSELYLSLRSKGANVILVPSAFTRKTGQSHWEPLLRARAIECQSYVIAAAQVGQHNAKRESYGHSCIIDPWGTVIAQCGPQNEGLCLAEVNMDQVRHVRDGMPVFEHRRPSLYTTGV